MRQAGRLAILGFGSVALALAPGDVSAHLFHKVYEPPENQLTRDARVLQLLVSDPTDRLELARAVYEGATRVRLKPGGYRTWLRRPTEPGLVFKADYQLNRWSGSLKTEALRIGRERGTALAARIEAGLERRDGETVMAALREMFALLLEELLESLWRRLDQPEVATRLYPHVSSYYAVNLEGYLNARHPSAATTARAALDAMARALPDPQTDAPAAPEAFDQQRRRFVRVLRGAMAHP
jgi:hypothetical protein